MAKTTTITIVTLNDDRMAESFVGAFAGEATKEQKRTMARRFNALLGSDPGAHDEDSRTLGFRTVDLAKTPKDLHELLNCFPEEEQHG